MPFTVGGDWVPSEKPKKQKKVAFRIEKRKGRILTIVEGLEDSKEQIFKELKKECHCGGSLKNGTFELQGDHLEKVKLVLEKKNLL